jgi:hypothetical protein
MRSGFVRPVLILHHSCQCVISSNAYEESSSQMYREIYEKRDREEKLGNSDFSRTRRSSTIFNERPNDEIASTQFKLHELYFSSNYTNYTFLQISRTILFFKLYELCFSSNFTHYTFLQISRTILFFKLYELYFSSNYTNCTFLFRNHEHNFPLLKLK